MRGALEIVIMMMRSFELRSALLLVVSLGLLGCPSDDSGDEGAESGAPTTAAETTAAETTAAETTAAEASTTGDMADSTTGGELILADIEVTVNYAGTAMGTLNVVAITEFPPSGPPLAVASDPAPTFPYVATLNDLEAGDYIIFAVLDVGNNNPTMPGMEDPVTDVTMPVMVTVDGPGPFTAEVTLVDPM